MICNVIAMTAMLVFGAAPESANGVKTKQPDEVQFLTLHWAGYEPLRADGSRRFWDVAVLRDLKPAAICVFYRPQKADGKEWHHVGMIPPGMLKDVLEQTKPELKISHDAGIEIIGYADTIMFHPDMLEAEGIAWEGLAARNADGTPIINKTWDKSGTHLACLNNPDWVDLQKKVVRLHPAAGFDALQFDVYPYAIEPGYLCHCKHCKRDWAEYSTIAFGSAQPIPGESGELDLSQPAVRAFIVWRWRIYLGFIKSMEREVAEYENFEFIMNHIAGLPDFMFVALHGGMNQPSTELWHINQGEESSLFLYKAAAEASGGRLIGLHNSVTQMTPSYRYRVALAEALAGDGTFYLSPGDPAHEEIYPIGAAYANFVEDHQVWLAGYRCEAECALLYSWQNQVFLQVDKMQKGTAKLSYTEDPYERAAWQLSSQHISYDPLILEKGITLEQLQRYSAVVVPELKLIEDELAAVLLQYIAAGGQLIAQGEFGTLKSGSQHEYVSREEDLIELWSGVKNDTPVVSVKAPVGDPRHMSATSHPDLKSAVASFGLFSRLEVHSGFTIQATVSANESRRSIHLIRMGAIEEGDKGSMHLRYALAVGARVKEVTIVSPGRTKEAIGASWRIADGRLEVEIEDMGQYTLVGIKLDELATQQ